MRPGTTPFIPCSCHGAAQPPKSLHVKGWVMSLSPWMWYLRHRRCRGHFTCATQYGQVVLSTQPNDRVKFPGCCLTKAGIHLLRLSVGQDRYFLSLHKKGLTTATLLEQSLTHLAKGDKRKTQWPALYQHFIHGDCTACRKWSKHAWPKLGSFQANFLLFSFQNNPVKLSFEGSYGHIM